MELCRYLGHEDGRNYCAYWNLPLRGDEDIRCYAGGWECYEEPGGCIFEGRWMTLTDYAKHLQGKSVGKIPEGYECQEFRLDSEGLADLWRSEKRYPVKSMTAYHLKIRPEYPKAVNAVAIAHFQYDTNAKRLYFDRPQGSQWVASLWIVDGPCEVDLAVVLKKKETGLEFIEGYCSHGDFCPKVEELKQAILESAPFAKLREDLIHELSERRVADLDRGGPQPFPQTVPPEEEDTDLSL